MQIHQNNSGNNCPTGIVFNDCNLLLYSVCYGYYNWWYMLSHMKYILWNININFWLIVTTTWCWKQIPNILSTSGTKYCLKGKNYFSSQYVKLQHKRKNNELSGHFICHAARLQRRSACSSLGPIRNTYVVQYAVWSLNTMPKFRLIQKCNAWSIFDYWNNIYSVSTQLFEFIIIIFSDFSSKWLYQDFIFKINV
jgi:hypothetical protein